MPVQSTNSVGPIAGRRGRLDWCEAPKTGVERDLVALAKERTLYADRSYRCVRVASTSCGKNRPRHREARNCQLATVQRAMLSHR